MKLSSAANAYVDKAAPWAEAKKGNVPRLGKILSRLLRVLEAISIMLWPAMPKKADLMRAQLGLAPLDPIVGTSLWPEGLPAARPEHPLAPAGPLFPTFDDKAQKEILERLLPEAAAPPEAFGDAASAGAPDGVAAAVAHRSRLPRRSTTMRSRRPICALGSSRPRRRCRRKTSCSS